MATLDLSQKLSLVELARRKDPDGNLAVIAEILNEDNEIVQDAPWIEANDTFSNKTTQRASLPQGAWRRINQGVSRGASSTAEVVDTIGMLEIYAEADKVLVNAAPNPRAFRDGEAAAFLEGLSQQLAEAIIYANAATDPEQFNGLAVRLASLTSTGTAKNMVFGCSGTGSDLTSIYVVRWDANKCAMLYPKGHPNMGIEHTDLGEVTLMEYDSAGAFTGRQYQGYRDHFQIKAGLVVKDPRCIGRVCNIETSGTSNIFDEDKLIALLNRMPGRGAGAKLYCNETVSTQMDILAKDKSNVNLTISEWAGQDITVFKGKPVRKVDQIIDTESALT